MKRPNIDKSRSLKKNLTDAERKLWFLLRNRQMAGVKFRRQFPIEKYILDFYSPEYELCIEADGGQHYEDNGLQRDNERSAILESLGVKVLRFNNREVLTNIEGVYDVILRAIEERKKTPSPQSSPPRVEEATVEKP
jgi:very-short-patch-repair endonuclease